MDWDFVFSHAISGYIPTVLILILYFIVLKIYGNNQYKERIILTFVFSFYLVGVLTTTGICLKPNYSPTFSFIPFIDMIRGPKDTILNIILFLPLGFFLPLLYKKYNCFSKVLLIGFLFSLSIEVIQMFGFGRTDVNDLITNTVGSGLGYGVYKLFNGFISNSLIKKSKAKFKYSYYEPIILWVIIILIMLTIQIYIYNIFFAININGEIHKW